jgi:hypothetical protein
LGDGGVGDSAATLAGLLRGSPLMSDGSKDDTSKMQISTMNHRPSIRSIAIASFPGAKGTAALRGVPWTNVKWTGVSFISVLKC